VHRTYAHIVVRVQVLTWYKGSTCSVDVVTVNTILNCIEHDTPPTPPTPYLSSGWGPQTHTGVSIYLDYVTVNTILNCIEHMHVVVSGVYCTQALLVLS
jgi:hypothetical protein